MKREAPKLLGIYECDAVNLQDLFVMMFSSGALVSIINDKKIPKASKFKELEKVFLNIYLSSESLLNARCKYYKMKRKKKGAHS